MIVSITQLVNAGPWLLVSLVALSVALSPTSSSTPIIIVVNYGYVPA